MKREPKCNDQVRVRGELPGSINEFARINNVSENNIWVVNLNMPYMGTISEHVSIYEFYKKYELI